MKSRNIYILAILLTLIVFPASAGENQTTWITSTFSDENSMDVSIQSSEQVNNGQLIFKLTYRDKLIETTTLDFIIAPGKEITKVIMWDFGMFTGRREIEMEIFVGFGASETFMTALSRGLLESCVTACEGAGTVIASSPTLAQGIGSRISGLVETTPIPELIQRIEEEGVRYLIRGRQPWTRWQGWKRQSGWGTCALAFQWYVHRMSLRCVNLKSSMM